MGNKIFSVYFLIFIQLSNRFSKAQEDASFQTFLKNAMREYPNWQSQRDPLPIITDIIKLKSDVKIDDGVDVNFTVKNQYISEFSKPKTSNDASNSDVNGKSFGITWATSFDDYFTYGGDYEAQGTISNGSQQVINFDVSGKWKLRSNESFEAMQILGYDVNGEGFIDLDKVLTKHSYSYVLAIKWLEIEFVGLELRSKNGNVDYQYGENGGVTRADELIIIKRIENVLAQLYRRFLTSSKGEYSVKVIPQQQLLTGYLGEVLSKTQYSDITSQGGTVILQSVLLYFGLTILITLV